MIKKTTFYALYVRLYVVSIRRRLMLIGDSCGLDWILATVVTFELSIKCFICRCCVSLFYFIYLFSLYLSDVVHDCTRRWIEHNLMFSFYLVCLPCFDNPNRLIVQIWTILWNIFSASTRIQFYRLKRVNASKGNFKFYILATFFFLFHGCVSTIFCYGFFFFPSLMWPCVECSE